MKKLILPDKVYGFLKWLLIIFVPAFNVWFEGLAVTWGWHIPVEAIIKTVNYTAAFLGAITLISNISYNLKKKAEE